MDEGIDMIQLTEIEDAFIKKIFINPSKIVVIEHRVGYYYTDNCSERIDNVKSSIVHTERGTYFILESPEEIIKLIKEHNA